MGKYRQSGRVVKMRKNAARAFLALQKAAKAQGHQLIPISGFRTLEYQKGLFDRAQNKHGGPQGAARWVAPPGHSEHHTGLTLDLGDGRRPETDVEQSFEKTELFQWLKTHAPAHGFELSFPKDNAQGVGYEPWHWRFVGDDQAKKIFHSR